MWWAYAPLVLGVALWGRFIWKYGMPYRPTTIKVPEPPELPSSFVYDWARDTGYLWTGPGDTAFWLEPETCDELAAWVGRYRPDCYGRWNVSDDVRIDWIEPIRNPYQNQYQNHFSNGLASMLYARSR